MPRNFVDSLSSNGSVRELKDASFHPSSWAGFRPPRRKKYLRKIALFVCFLLMIFGLWLVLTGVHNIWNRGLS